MCLHVHPRVYLYLYLWLWLYLLSNVHPDDVMHGNPVGPDIRPIE